METVTGSDTATATPSPYEYPVTGSVTIAVPLEGPFLATDTEVVKPDKTAGLMQGRCGECGFPVYRGQAVDCMGFHVRHRSRSDCLYPLRHEIAELGGRNAKQAARIAALEAALKEALSHIKTLVVPETSWTRDTCRPNWAGVMLDGEDFRDHQAAQRWLQSIAERSDNLSGF